MDVRDGFAGVGAAVDDEAEAIGEAEFFCDGAGGHDEMTEDRLIGGGGIADPGDQLLRNDQQVHGRLGLDVMDDDAAFVLVLDAGGNFAVDDFLEKSLGHRRNF